MENSEDLEDLLIEEGFKYTEAEIKSNDDNVSEESWEEPPPLASAKNGDTNISEIVMPFATVHRKTKKIGRNDPCGCGSGKKHKKCCSK